MKFYNLEISGDFAKSNLRKWSIWKIEWDEDEEVDQFVEITVEKLWREAREIG